MGNTQCKPYFYESEARRIAVLNEVFGDVELTAAEMRTLVWLVGWEDSMTANLFSAISKVTAAETKRLEQPHRP
ncbi:hypothetical protein NE689_00435 [Lactonifactor longoviformis]|uniref:hypothetical protein n=1 Tax=Lactonifactor longoviformis TaxID=341220 RepID=UPI002109EF23|nr:hypothetical protein [Lactonifactor longoviformis]MCQ4669767.1 hypothetical protein [Lactonifactor longoviformis]